MLRSAHATLFGLPDGCLILTWGTRAACRQDARPPRTRCVGRRRRGSRAEDEGADPPCRCSAPSSPVAKRRATSFQMAWTSPVDMGFSASDRRLDHVGTPPRLGLEVTMTRLIRRHGRLAAWE